MHERRFTGDISRLRSIERVERLEIERVADACLEESQVSSVLDVGTGTGLFAEVFAGRGSTVSGVDVNAGMLAAARGFVPNGDFRLGTAERLPYPDDSFDLVFLGLVLHETDDILTALKEAFRVARIRVCILEWPFRDQPFGPPLAERLNPDDLVVLFNRTGFQKWKLFELSNTVLFCLDVPASIE